MAYNPALYFPQSYQPQMYQPGQSFNFPQMQIPAQSTPAQMMTPPTIHAEIIQVDNELAASQYPVGAGTSQMMMAKDDSGIYVKTATPNGFTLDVFEKREKPQESVFNPADYIRKDEIETLVSAILAGQTATKHGKRENDDE